MIFEATLLCGTCGKTLKRSIHASRQKVTEAHNLPSDAPAIRLLGDFRMLLYALMVSVALQRPDGLLIMASNAEPKASISTNYDRGVLD